MKHMQFTVVREGYTHFACVSAFVLRSDLETEQGFLNALKDAVTEWIETTDEGKEAWEYSSNDFNVGDLSAYTTDRRFAQILQQHGIRHLTIDTNGDCKHWTYDTVLAHEHRMADV